MKSWKPVLIPPILLLLTGCGDAESSERQVHPAVDRDPPAAAPYAAMVPTTFTSAGRRLVGNLLVAQGPGPHPTALLLHGFPGNENNYDLAHVLRRAGWNVFVFHYRGSWGSEGSFTFGGVAADVRAALDFLQHDAGRLRVDPERFVLIGHSMGGFAALDVAADDERVGAAASLAGFNFGGFTARYGDDPEAIEDITRAFAASLAPLRGATGESLVREMLGRGAEWDLRRVVHDLRERPVLLVAAERDGVAPPELHHEPLVRAFREAGAARLTARRLASDHAFSDRRVALAELLLDWLDTGAR